MNPHEYLPSHSADETFSLGQNFASQLHNGDCVALMGELGSGKTQFVRGVCDFFHCPEQVTSPTFTIVNEYHGSVKIAHCDLYRLDSPDEIFETGFMSELYDDVIVFIEWAEKALTLLPLPRWEIYFRHGEDEEERLITMQRCVNNSKTLLRISHELHSV